MTKIVLVTHSLGQGGTERVAVHLANGLSRTEDVTLMMAVPHRHNGQALYDALSERVSVHVLGRRRHSRSADFAFAFVAWVRWLWRERPDIIVSTGNNACKFTAAGFALRGYRGGQLFIKTTNPIIQAGKTGIPAAFRRTTYIAICKIASGILALSEAERRRLSAQFPFAASKICAVANPYVTPEMLATGTARTAPAANAPRRVIGIGRLHRQKNFGLLIRAWASADRGDSQLVIVGDGPDRAALVGLAQSLGVASSVVFAGYQSDILPWLQSADLFVLSSSFEGLPAVVIEALATECPVVATDCFEAARELLGDVPGCLLVPPEDEQALGDAISRALATPPAPGSLAERAMPYRIDTAIASHRTALTEGASYQPISELFAVPSPDYASHT